MIDCNYNSKKHYLIRNNMNLFLCGNCATWEHEKKKLEKNVCFNFFIKKQIRSHVLQIDDDATNRLYVNILSLFI